MNMTEAQFARLTGGKPAKRRKYGNKVIECDGERFDSRREYQRWRELQTLQMAGEIAIWSGDT